MTVYTELVKKIDSHLTTKIKDQNYIIRISDGEDLFKILTYGTDRANLSPKLWEPLTPVDFKIIPKHEDVIIGSTYEELIADSYLENGTLQHKINIIEYPLAVCYKLEDLDILYKEPKTDTQNQGIHFTFKKNESKKDAIIDIFWIKKTLTKFSLHLYNINMQDIYK